MDKTWILVLAAFLFLLNTVLFWRITANYRKKEFGKRMWKIFGAQTFYWQTAIYISAGSTILEMFLLKWTTILTF